MLAQPAVCLSVCLSVCVCLSICVFASLSTHPPASPHYAGPACRQFVCLSVCVFVRLCVCLSVDSSTCLAPLCWHGLQPLMKVSTYPSARLCFPCCSPDGVGEWENELKFEIHKTMADCIHYQGLGNSSASLWGFWILILTFIKKEEEKKCTSPMTGGCHLWHQTVRTWVYSHC